MPAGPPGGHGNAAASQFSEKSLSTACFRRHHHGRMIHYYFNINVAFFDLELKKPFFY
jgi:hypothetical protein